MECRTQCSTQLQFSATLPREMPWTVGRGMLIAVIATLLAHALLPSHDTLKLQTPAAPPNAVDGLRVLGKALGLVVAMIVTLLIDEKSAMLASVTLGQILTMSDPRSGWSFGIRVTLSNLIAFLVAMPTLLLLLIRPQPFVAILVACATGIVLAKRAVAGGPTSLPAIAIPTFALVLGLYATTAATGTEDILGEKLFKRLAALITGVVFGIAIHALLSKPHGPADAAKAAV